MNDLLAASVIRPTDGSFQGAAFTSSLTLSPTELEQASGGYKRASDQIRELHRRGFVRAYRGGPNGKVVLERSHYEAVTRGHFGDRTIHELPERPRAAPNRAEFLAIFGKRRKP